MFSLTVEYALRAAVYLAEFRQRRVTAQEVAAECQVPVSYMSKVLQALTEAGLISSQRGPSGGFLLAQEPEQISMYDVVNVIHPIERIHSCPLDLPEHSHRLCPLHAELDGLAVEASNKLKSLTLADLLAEPEKPIEIEVNTPNRSASM